MLLGAGLALLAVFVVDEVTPERWTETGMALSAAGAIAGVFNGHDYSIPQDVAWTDARGGYHQSGRPDCLPPTGKQEGPVRITAVTVAAAGYEQRQVVHVECLT